MQTLFIGKEHLKFNELNSTNTYLKELVRTNSIMEGTVVQCSYQTSGRGQFGNQWIAEKEKNLLFSLLLKPRLLKAEQQFYLNMSVCLALTDALNTIEPGFIVKWPNDILYNGSKVCGVLIENSLTGNAIEYSIIGIGLNVNQQDFIYPDAISLKTITGKSQDIQQVLEKILIKIEQRYLQLKSDQLSIKRDYLAKLYAYKNPVTATIAGVKKDIQVEDVEAGGKLICKVSGEPRTRAFNFKEINFVLP